MNTVHVIPGDWSCSGVLFQLYNLEPSLVYGTVRPAPVELIFWFFVRFWDILGVGANDQRFRAHT
jgi:hypothetical protein